MNSLIKISYALKWSGFLSSFLIMASVTSLPELFVGVGAAFHKYPQLSFGNIVGANIVNLTLGVSMISLACGSFAMRAKKDRENVIYTILFSFLPFLLILDKTLSRIDGLILLSAAAFYVKKILSEGKTTVHPPFHLKDLKATPSLKELKSFLKNVFLFIFSVIILLFSAEAILRLIKSIAFQIGMPLVSAGAVLISLSTALPEISFGVRAGIKKRPDLAWGNISGTVIINSAFVLGIVAVIYPIKIVNAQPYITIAAFALLASFSLLLFRESGRGISRKEALFLFFVYTAFVLAQVLRI